MACLVETWVTPIDDSEDDALEENSPETLGEIGERIVEELI